ncbi:MAG: D-alanyl-D-alanine carboxypeptidase/D-alanyl-D-alanine-endopeptidase [Gammaproteobacteria bacterium]|nr:D-alanyl-D-alanine carboxypeptidase/D-alanyl-D-alanine-endopeptidase [Gammaproteobacteria bacterium]
MTPSRRLAGILLALCTITLHSAPAAAGELPGEISRLLSKYGVPENSVSLVIREAGPDREVLSLNPHVPRNPASVIKLLTTVAALELLGPAYQWETRYFVDGKVDAEGRLRGNLIMQGGGDPFLTVERFWHHVLALRQRGIRHVDGNLIIDNTLFKIPRHDRAAFDGKPLRLYNVGPDAALTNFSATRFVIEPLDGRIHVFADPPLANLVVINKLTPSKGKCASRNAGWSLRLERAEGRILARFSGKYRTRCGAHSLSRSYFSNQEYTYRLFRYLWESAGGTLRGGYRTGSTPETATQLVTMTSRSLAENVAGINKYSNNVMARQLLLTIGRERNPDSEADTRAAGIEAVMDWLDRAGVDTRSLVIDNGAGLSRTSRTTAAQVARLLAVAWHSNWQPEFLASLSLSAMDGTMRRRLQETGLAGRARIKTGLINGVRSMAGYVHAANGRHYTVTMFIHSPKINFWNGNRIQDAVLEWIYRRP